MNNSQKAGFGCSFLGLTLGVLFLVGEILCIVKAVRCNWEPIGKAEVVYTVSACCGLGCIVGWIDIEDK